ncbi:MAG: DUF86 domain-containing protein [Prevotella sp.]|nr:DUF86 domain-containing protein [Prevotella sp.]
MREAIKDKNRLEHMLDAIKVIQDRTSGMTLEDLMEDKIVYGGIVYYTMIIGEAAYMLTKEFKDAHPATPWRQIEGMRHHIVHGYFQVREDMLWNVIQKDLQPLKEQLLRYIDEKDNSIEPK